MARGFPQSLVEDLWRVALAVIAGEPAAHIGDQSLEDGPALGVPEHHARAFLLEMEQVELAAEFAMVALLGFLDLPQVSVELFLLRKCRAVDARQHRIVAVTTAIRARDLHQLEGVTDLAGRGHMRAAAEREPVALEIDLDRLVAGNGVDQLDLEILAFAAEHLFGLFAIPDFFCKRFVARNNLAPLLFDSIEI